VKGAWLVFILVGLILVAGCASLANSRFGYVSVPVSVPVYTQPPGAKLIVAGRTYYSPDVVKLPRGVGDFIMTVEKTGYRPERILLKRSVDGFVGYNVLNLGLGLIQDFRTGGLYDIDPEIVRVQLVRESE